VRCFPNINCCVFEGACLRPAAGLYWCTLFDGTAYARTLAEINMAAA